MKPWHPWWKFGYHGDLRVFIVLGLFAILPACGMMRGCANEGAPLGPDAVVVPPTPTPHRDDRNL